MASEKITLSKEQELKVLEKWNLTPDDPPSLKELVEEAWGEGIDTRSKKARAVRSFLADHNLRPKVSYIYEKKKGVKLTQEQKEYITNNLVTMSHMEMARVLFDDTSIGPNSRETQAVGDYIKSLPPTTRNQSFNEVANLDLEDYKPPKTVEQAKKRVNTFAPDKIKDEDMELTNILYNLEALISFCHMQNFNIVYNQYTNLDDRKMFEGAFVRFVWNKPDLTEEELESYILLCREIVQYNNLASELNNLRRIRDEQLARSDDENRRISINMGLVESIATLSKQIDDSYKRQERLLKSLNGTREERIKNKRAENASVIQLVEAWRDQQKRKELIDIANKRKDKVKKEIDRIKTLDEVKAQMFGLDRESFDI